VVVGTPGRVLDHLKRGALSFGRVRHVVLDESDRMLDMGFREELEAILEGMPAERRTHLVSATFPASVRKLAGRFQRDALHVEGTALGVANRDIEHVAHLVERHDVYGAIVNLLLLNEGKRCLVFVERRVEAAELAEKLSSDGFPVQAFSGELAQAQRTRTINAFRDGTMKTLVSTDVAARGLDVPDIELVIHAEPPDSADTYVHRSGRTGRAGSAGHSVMLVAPRARRHCERMLSAARIEASWKPVPSAAKVERELRRRFRHEVHTRLAAEEGPSQEHVDYAKGLLDGRDPAAVVALLLEIAQPKPARRPVDVREAREVAHERGVSDTRGRPKGRGAARKGTGTPGPCVRFSINWGEESGATAARVLGHVCRRGQVRSQLVGAIDIGPAETRFEVDASVATRFEACVKKRDPRDPALRIVRAGPPAGGPKRPKGAGRPHRPHAKGAQARNEAAPGAKKRGQFKPKPRG
jgi:ATP-dependent RNA helicase DeaD